MKKLRKIASVLVLAAAVVFAAGCTKPDEPNDVVNYTVKVLANPEEGGTVKGAGTYAEGETCKLTAVASEGYTFANWTENGEVVANDSNYNFTVTSNRNLVANFDLETSPAIEGGLMVYYPFDGNANDASGNGYHATPCNSFHYGEGKLGEAIGVVGEGWGSSSGGHVLLPEYDFDISTGITLSLWVKAEGLSVNDGEAYINFGNDIGSNSENRMYIMQFPTYIKFVYNECTIFIPYENSYTGTWVMYTLTCNPEGQMMAYVNDEIVGEDQVNYNAQWNTSLAALGRHWWNGEASNSTRFIGSFDEVRIYNRAITPEEVQTLYSFN